jgi:hypothetical protein
MRGAGTQAIQLTSLACLFSYFIAHLYAIGERSTARQRFTQRARTGNAMLARASEIAFHVASEREREREMC